MEWTRESSVEFSQCHLSCSRYPRSRDLTEANLKVHSTYGLENLDKVAQANLSANIVSTLQAGCFFGALLASPAADRWGRRTALLGSAVVGILGVIMQAAASGHLEAMYIGRSENYPSIHERFN